jgi:hypothetical protein
VSDAAAPGQTVGGKGLCLALFGVYLGKQPVSQVSLTRARRPRSGHVHTVAPRAVRFGSLVGPASAAQLERFEAVHLRERERLSLAPDAAQRPPVLGRGDATWDARAAPPLSGW